MKKNLFIGKLCLCNLFCVIFLTSCNSIKPEIQAITNNNGTISTLTVGAPYSSRTKVSFEDMGAGTKAGMKLTWEENDIITIYSVATGARQGDFNCTKVDNGYATFVGVDNFKLVDKDEYIAVYPKSEESSFDSRNQRITTELEDQKTIENDESDCAHLDNYLFMKCEFKASLNNNIKFEYEVSTFLLSFNWTGNEIPTNVELSDQGYGTYKVKNTNGFTIKNNMGTAYFMIRPNTSTAARQMFFRIGCTDYIREYSYETTKPYTFGKTFRVTISSFPPKDYIEDNGLFDEKPINHGEAIEVNGINWAPVNLGYDKEDYPYGKLYQWGRIDGQGYNSGNDKDATYPSRENNTIILGPVEVDVEPLEDVFYTSSNETTDWSSRGFNEGNINNWKGDHNDKVGNPCPDGWRIPTIKEIQTLIGGQNSRNPGNFQTNELGQTGYYFDESDSQNLTTGIFFPTAGYRVRHGNALNRGTEGHYWTSESSDDGANSFYMQQGNIYKRYRHRSNALSIRCVQE